MKEVRRVLRFQMTGMIEGFLGFEVFDFRIFFGRKTWQVLLVA